MTIQTTLGDCYIKWHHFRKEWIGLREMNALTECLVEDHTIDPPRVLEGEAYCSRLDNFNKETGRKLSLKRAIAKFPKTIRREIWNAYLNRTKQQEKE